MTDLWYNCEETGRRFVYNSTRVLLVDGGYDPGADDPLAGTDYECEGLIIGPARDDEYPLEVAWDNGHINQYRANDLDIVGQIPIQPSMKEDNPNKAFRAHKSKQSYTITHTDLSVEVKGVRKIRDAIGVSVAEAYALYNAHGDADTAITHYNLEHGSAEASLGRTTDAALFTASPTTMATDTPQTDTNQHSVSESVSYSSNIFNDEELFDVEEAMDIIANKVSDGVGCDPISTEELQRRSSAISRTYTDNEMISEEFDEAQSTENIANRTIRHGAKYVHSGIGLAKGGIVIPEDAPELRKELPDPPRMRHENYTGGTVEVKKKKVARSTEFWNKWGPKLNR